MAKGKKGADEAAPAGNSADEFTDRIYDSVGEEYGGGVMVSGAQAVAVPSQSVSWTPTLDIILSGGIKEGSWVGITGHEKVGKTVGALCLAASAQRPENGSRPVYYAKVEGRLSLDHLQGIKGLDLSKGRFNIIQSRKGKILSAEDFLKIIEQILKTVPGAFVIIDSISALCDERETAGGVGTETRGGGAKLFSQWCRLMNQVVPVNQSIVVGITHLISNTSGMGKQYFERCARMWLYQKDYAIRAVMTTPWKTGEKQIGLVVKWACNTSKNGPPGMTIESHLRFGVGFDRLYELVNLGSAAGLIQKSGSWFQLSFLGKDEHKHLLTDTTTLPKYQGGEKVYEAVAANPEWAAALEKGVMALAGNLTGSEA